LFLGHGETVHHGGRVWQKKVAYFITAKKQRERDKEEWVKVRYTL
jgi:hypothetical protein